MSNKYIKNIITNKLEWGKYVSPFSDRNLAPYNWYAFKHRFGSELVTKIFSSFGLQKGDTILDPFCGGGTTLIKAKFDGYNAFGLDISPFSVFLSNVLTQTCDPIRLKSSLNKISHKVNPRVEIPDVAILTKSFSEPTLKYIYSLRDSINLLSSTERKFYLFTLLSILNGISKAKKAGGFLRITDQRKIPLNIVRTKFQQAAEKLIDEVENFQYSDSTVLAIRGDARKYPAKIKNRKYDAILTSPPYPNRHDYTRIYELELLVGFIEDNNSLKSLRYKTLRSHVEAKEKYKAAGYEKPALLKKKISALKKCELNNSQIISTIEGYFEDMYLALKEMSHVLKVNGHIGLVVSNVRFAGVMIPVDKLLCELGEQVGLKPEGINVLRYRGNSAQQMLTHKKMPTRESLIVWQKK